MRGILKKCGILSVICVAAILGCGGDSSSDDVGSPTELEGTWKCKSVVDATEYDIYTFTYTGKTFTLKAETFNGSDVSQGWTKSKGTFVIGSEVTVSSGKAKQITYNIESSVDQNGVDVLDEDDADDDKGKDIFMINGNALYFGGSNNGDDGYPTDLDMTEKFEKQ